MNTELTGKPKDHLMGVPFDEHRRKLCHGSRGALQKFRYESEKERTAVRSAGSSRSVRDRWSPSARTSENGSAVMDDEWTSNPKLIEHVVDRFSPKLKTRKDRMFSLQSRKQRPLGHIVPDSRIDQQVEKAMFRTNAKILAEMCMNKKLKPREIIEHQSFQTSASSRPETRWLLTRSATLQRVNNAEFSKYDNHIRDRVVSADDIRRKGGLFLDRQKSMCNRENSFDKSADSHVHCEVLGPSFCFDCIKVRERRNILQEQNVNFPKIEVHPRSLIAPAKIEKMILSYPDEIFNDNKSYGYGAVLDSRVLFNEPIVYTQNEVYTRLRLLHKEKGRDVFKSKKKIKEKEPSWNIASSWVQKDIANAQPQAITSDSMKVSVKFKSQ